MKIGDSVWHPCNLDIIEHKVVSVRQFEGFNHYVLKAKHNVGACGRVEVIIDEHKGKFRFVELLNEESLEYSSGLGDFIEGNYYSNKEGAELEFYEQQRMLTVSSVWKFEGLLKEAQARKEQVELLVKALKEKIKITKIE
jgi:hypothetical protein